MSRALIYVKPVHVLFFRARGSYASSVDQAWGRMFAWMDVHGLGAEVDTGYGLAHDDPRTTAADLCRYDACIPVPQHLPPEAVGELQTATLPAGVYARDRVSQSYARLGSMLASIRDEWVPRNGLTVDRQRPVLTIYRNNPRFCSPETLEAEICLPILAPGTMSSRVEAA